jgi:hypothetical protein
MFLRQIDPLIRELTEYRDFINLKIKEQPSPSKTDDAAEGLSRRSFARLCSAGTARLATRRQWL